MAREKKKVHKVQMTEGKRNIIHQLLEEYDIESAEDIQDALKDLLGGTIKEMMEVEMEDHLGYGRSERSDNEDSRNGYKAKQVNSRYGTMEIDVPQDRKSSFNPSVVKKRQKDISDIDQKIISMYAKGMTTRQISETLDDIYGFEASEGFISDVTDKILPQIEEWQNRPLAEVYPVIFIDAIHYSVRDNGVIRKLAAYVVLGINKDGRKEVLNDEDNSSISQATNMPRIVLFKKEKGEFSPLPPRRLREKYHLSLNPVAVTKDSLVSYKSNKYSVPKRFIGFKVNLVVKNSQLHIYYNNKIITVHQISKNKLNIKEAHELYYPKKNDKTTSRINEIIIEEMRNISYD